MIVDPEEWLDMDQLELWPEDMTMTEYAAEAMQHCIYPDNTLYPVLGLLSEAGEVADKLKKHFRDGEGVEEVKCQDALVELPLELREGLALELGDCLFYITAIASDIGYDLEEIAAMNLEKLEDRSERNVLKGSGDYR